MNKTKADERKRTVTVVTGMKTVALIDALVADWAKTAPGLHINGTDVCGMALERGLAALATRGVKGVAEAAFSHFD